MSDAKQNRARSSAVAVLQEGDLESPIVVAALEYAAKHGGDADAVRYVIATELFRRVDLAAVVQNALAEYGLIVRGAGLPADVLARAEALSKS